MPVYLLRTTRYCHETGQAVAETARRSTLSGIYKYILHSIISILLTSTAIRKRILDSLKRSDTLLIRVGSGSTVIRSGQVGSRIKKFRVWHKPRMHSQ